MANNNDTLDKQISLVTPTKSPSILSNTQDMPADGIPSTTTSLKDETETSADESTNMFDRLLDISIAIVITCICIAALMVIFLKYRRRKDKDTQEKIIFGPKSIELGTIKRETGTGNKTGETNGPQTKSPTENIDTYSSNNYGKYNQNQKMQNAMKYNLPHNELMQINSNSAVLPRSIADNVNVIHLSYTSRNHRDPDVNIIMKHPNKFAGNIGSYPDDEKVMVGDRNRRTDGCRDTLGNEAYDMDTGTGTGTTSGEGTTGTSDEGTKEISSHPTNSSHYLQYMNDNNNGLQLCKSNGNEPKAINALPMTTMQPPSDVDNIGSYRHDEKIMERCTGFRNTLGNEEAEQMEIGTVRSTTSDQGTTGMYDDYNHNALQLCTSDGNV